MASLFLVPFQLSLPGFDFVSQGLPFPKDRDKENRTGAEWLESARDWCLWRAGASWRSRQRVERDFVDAARCITDILVTGGKLTPKEEKQAKLDAAAQAELDIMRGAAIPLSASEFKLTKENRNALVAELLRDPLYTDARLLRSLTKNKLARMVMQSRQRRVADAQTERRSA